MTSLIVIPARYHSTRFPGKPLKLISGRTMLERTAHVAKLACEEIPDTDYTIATDDERIEDFCIEKNIPVVMTSDTLTSGSDRALEAANIYIRETGKKLDFVLNFQGDAPFTPKSYLLAILRSLKTGCDVATPFVVLSWDDLDGLRAHKKDTPFSGTTVVVDATQRALWFSKNIIPAIRNEKKLRTASETSPIRRHIGLYGFAYSALSRFTEISESPLESLEGLEQLRMVENGFDIRAIEVEPAQISISGIDTLEDLKLAELMIQKHGDPQK